MKPEYEPKTVEQKLGKFVEECGEALAAAGKTQRWGLDSTNPELKPGDPLYGETNRQWLLREMADVEESIAIVRAEIDPPTCTDCLIHGPLCPKHPRATA